MDKLVLETHFRWRALPQWKLMEYLVFWHIIKISLVSFHEDLCFDVFTFFSYCKYQLKFSLTIDSLILSTQIFILALFNFNFSPQFSHCHCQGWMLYLKINPIIMLARCLHNLYSSHPLWHWMSPLIDCCNFFTFFLSCCVSGKSTSD